MGMTEASEKTLRGCCVLVTRPAGQAEELLAAIEARGGAAVHIPALAIEPLTLDALVPASTLVRQLHTFQHVVFVSCNAVHCGLDLIRIHRDDLSAMPACYAIGPATAAALRKEGIEVMAPEKENASGEGLAVLAPLQSLEGQRVLIFRGIGGSENLATVLNARGAEVHYCEVYRRTCPNGSGVLLRTALREKQVHAATATSVETLNNLLVLAGREVDALRSLPLCVFGKRMAARAKQSRCMHVIEASSNDSEAVVEALISSIG